jgi:hypothetical protein
VALAIAEGTVTISATAGNISGSAALTVQPTGFVGTGNLNTPRSSHTATLLNNGTVLIAGGMNNVAYLASAELYNSTTESFTPTTSMNYARYGHTATLLNDGTVLIASGGESAIQLNSAELYDPTKKTFTLTGSLNSARVYHTATLLNDGTVLIVGGDSHGTINNTAELYDPTKKTFTYTKGNLNTGRYGHTATLLNNGMVLIAGGIGYPSGYPLDSAELYNPTTGTFTLIAASMNAWRADATATLLNNGMVLIAGGNGSGAIGGCVGPQASAELYNPANETFTVTTSMNTARCLDTATLLNSGMVLMAGGENYSGYYSASAELYNPAIPTFTVTSSMNYARAAHTATLLNNGMVLIAGGYNSSNGYLASAELYSQ